MSSGHSLRGATPIRIDKVKEGLESAKQSIKPLHYSMYSAQLKAANTIGGPSEVQRVAEKIASTLSNYMPANLREEAPLPSAPAAATPAAAAAAPAAPAAAPVPNAPSKYPTSIPVDSMKEFKSAEDGWCFYRSVLKGYASIEDSTLPTSNSGSLSKEVVNEEIVPFVAQIVETVKEDPEYEIYSQIYNATNEGQDIPFHEYIENLPTIDEGGKDSSEWADPQFGIGKAATSILGKDIVIYEKDGNIYQWKQEYIADTPTSSAPIYLAYVGGNHYNLLVPAAPVAPAALAAAAAPAPAFGEETSNTEVVEETPVPIGTNELVLNSEEETVDSSTNTDSQILDAINRKIKECETSCKVLKDQKLALESKVTFSGELPVNAKLIDLLESIVLDPVATWKDTIERLINIPNNVKGDRLRGGDYFEAFFQLAFALKLIPDITGFVMKQGGQTISPIQFIYEKSVKNSGGGEHGIVDIHFTTGGYSITNDTYACGEMIVDEPNDIPPTYFISAKNYYNEKNPASYDIDKIRNEILTQYHIKQSYVCVACRDAEAFTRRLDKMKTERLKLSINRVFGMNEIIRFFESYRNIFFSNIDSLDKKIIHASLPPREKKLKSPLSLYFHQELIIHAVHERYIHQQKTTSHYTCIGVLPRGGKSYIAGGIMKKFDASKDTFAVLFISSAINETMSQFKDDLIEKFSDFEDYAFINIKELPRDNGKEYKRKYAGKKKVFIFVSRELITGPAGESECGPEVIPAVETKLKDIFKRLDPVLQFDILFFDEAHKGGITSKTREALQKVSKGTAPVILLSATYKKLLDSQRGHINEKEDLFIWDLDDVRSMRTLAMSPSVEAFCLGQSGKKHDMFERYSNTKIQGILQRRVALGESLASIASPYVKFPEPYFLSTTFTPSMSEKLKALHSDDPLIGFSINKCFELLEDTDGIMEDKGKFKEWHRLFQNKADITTIRAMMTPRDEGRIEEGQPGIFPLDAATEENKFLNRIFKITSKDGIHARPNPSNPFSILMFLPVGKENSLVGHTCRAWASLLHQERFWRDKFVFVVLSPLVCKPHIFVKPAEVSISQLSSVPEESGPIEVLEGQQGGARIVCVDNGYCDIEDVNGSDLKSKIQMIEKDALRNGKGLVILTGKRATMGISLPCVDVVCMFDEITESDEIIQKMYRALTDSPNKKYGFVIDLNPRRIIQSQYEYKDVKNKTRKEASTTESVTAIVQDIIRTGLFDVDAIVSYEQKGMNDTMMNTIRDDMIAKLTKTAFQEYEKTMDTQVPVLLQTILTKEIQMELSGLLSDTDVKGRAIASKVHTEISATAPPGIESVPSEGGPVPSKKAPKVLTEEQRLANDMKKIPTLLKQFVNTLLLRDEAEMTADTNHHHLRSLVDRYENDKKEMIGKEINCHECADTNNLYARAYCGLFEFMKKDSEKTRRFLEIVVPYLANPTIYTIYNNYIEEFMAAMDKVPSIQHGGERESSQKRYNSILQVIDDHLVPDEAAKSARGEVFTPPALIREMLLGIRKSAIEKGITEIWGIDADGNFFDDDESERVGGIPLHVFRDPKSTWLDPANGIGNFPIILFYILDYYLRYKLKNDDERRKHIIEKMLFMIEIDKGNVETSKGLFKKIYSKAKPNILCANTLELTEEKLKKAFGTSRFTVIMGNPPFNPPKTETGSSGNSIWQNFVIKSHPMLNAKGYLIFVHPPGWKKPTDDVFKPEKFADGDYTGQIRQGQVWQVLKDSGVFKFIYTNDQKSKALGEEYLPHFPAVDYYVYEKGGDKSTCDTKNVFLGTVENSKYVRLNYNLKYLPNLITKETQDILYRITSKEGGKAEFGRFRNGKGFSIDSSKGKYKYIYTYNKKSEPKYQYSDIIGDNNINLDKVIMNFDGGIDCYTIQYIKKEERLGSYEMTMYSKVESDKEGKCLESFFKSDIVKFIFLITQYASGKMTKNEPLVANSITIPPEGISDYYKFFGIEEHKKYIEDILAHYEKFKAPKRLAKTVSKKKGGSHAPRRMTRRKPRI